MNDFERLMQNNKNMKSFIQKLLFNKSLLNIEVIDPETVHPKNVDRYYEWLQKTGNIYLCDNEKISNSFEKIPDYGK